AHSRGGDARSCWRLRPLQPTLGWCSLPRFLLPRESCDRLSDTSSLADRRTPSCYLSGGSHSCERPAHRLSPRPVCPRTAPPSRFHCDIYVEKRRGHVSAHASYSCLHSGGLCSDLRRLYVYRVDNCVHWNHRVVSHSEYPCEPRLFDCECRHRRLWSYRHRLILSLPFLSPPRARRSLASSRIFAFGARLSYRSFSSLAAVLSPAPLWSERGGRSCLRAISLSPSALFADSQSVHDLRGYCGSSLSSPVRMGISHNEFPS